MSTVEDFENAPVGATATHPVSGSRAMKVNDGDQYWITQWGSDLSDGQMGLCDYTLDAPAPATAREALDLAWELAHEVKPGQVIPKGTRYLDKPASGLKEFTASHDFEISPGIATRTVEPLPEPEPEWLDAPAVLARLKTWIPGAAPRVFARYEHDHSYWLAIDPPAHHWTELTDVTPLYPKGDE